MEFLVAFTACFLTFMISCQILMPFMSRSWYSMDNNDEAHYVLRTMQAEPRFTKVSRPGQANVVKWTAADGRVYQIAVRRIG